MLFFLAVSWLLLRGVGIWGVNIPVAWGFAIVNFVWWIGIGHAGTFISAILLLLFQHWRTADQSFRRSDDAFRCRVRRACFRCCISVGLGFFTGCCRIPTPWECGRNFAARWSGMFSPSAPTSPFRFYFGISGWCRISPPCAIARTKMWQKKFYGVLALGWRNSAAHWQRHQMAYLLLAGLATPLVLSVHSVVSLDFAVAQLPGWHSTIFPPYFVAGAIYSGFAMVLNIVIPVRKIYHLEHLITERYLNNMANIMFVTGMMVAYGYFIEAFMSWYSGDIFEEYMMINRAFGPYGWIFWVLMLCNVIIPQALWSARIRRNPLTLFVVALFINIGMWIERFVIVITSLHRDFVPSSWGMFFPTIWDWATLFGSVGLFLTLLFLFVRFLPMISISE